MLKCGFYETEITPPLGLCIPGYYEERRADNTRHKLYAKAAVMECNGIYAAYLVLDTLYIPQGLCKTVRERVSSNTAIPKDNILIAATHTHTSMPVSADKYGNDDIELVAKVLENVALRSADAVIMAFKRMEEGKIKFGNGNVEGISFVREYVMKDGSICTNPARHTDAVKSYSQADTSLPVLIFENSDGKPMGAITSFALHHDTVGGNEYDSDFSGIVSEKVKKIYGEDFILLFFAGFCGNINHIDFLNNRDEKATEEIADNICREFIRVAKNMEGFSSDTLDVSTEYVTVNKRFVDEEFIERAKYLRENPPSEINVSISEPYSDSIVYEASSQILNWYVEDKRQVYELPVQVIRIGDCFIYAMVGEVFSQFGDMIKKESPTHKNILISMANADSADVRGYFPIPELYISSVYESALQSAEFDEDSGIAMTRAIIELAKK